MWFTIPECPEGINLCNPERVPLGDNATLESQPRKGCTS